MNIFYQIIRFSGDDCARTDSATLAVLPEIIDTGKQKGLAAFKFNIYGNFFFALLFPFIKSVGKNEATASFE
jgi:hypothetical protein